VIGHVRHDFESVTSTNDLARAAYFVDALEGTVFIAEHQTAGRGRRGTTWTDSAGQSVLMTILLYPSGSVNFAWQFGWAACVAVIDCLAHFGIDAKCKWPNDVVVNHRKVSGVLVETLNRRSGFVALIGIGVNVLQEQFEADRMYRVAPTSMRMVTGLKTIKVSEVADQICLSMDSFYHNHELLWPAVAARYHEALVTGDTQSGVDLETFRLTTGCLMNVRDSDGSACLINSSGDERYVVPVTADPLGMG
jgi:BirA family transcriptional regulator, biotin operon repressor / biotin---[acetyl-CoA-carboxylase] ligase